MKPFRFSIAAISGVVAISAVGLMGLREGKPPWASLAFCLALAFLLGASLKATIGPASTRPGATGFALFGWAYLVTVFGPWGKLDTPPMPQRWAVDAMLERVHPQPSYEYDSNVDWQAISHPVVVRRRINLGPPQRIMPGSVAWSGDADSFRQSAHAMGALVFGLAGLVAGRWVAGRDRPREAAESGG
jgi:hypothetical protein